MSEIEAASGEGAEFFTDRSLFYLQNRIRINEWWNLRNDATHATSRFLESLAEPISGIAADWIAWDGTIGKFRCLFLVPPGIDVSEIPWTGVALGWVPQGVMPAVRNQAPWVGLYGYPEHEAAEKLRSALDAVESGASGYESSKWWPRYRWIPGEERWWTDLDGYRGKLLDEYRSLLTRYRIALESIAS